MVGFGRRAGLSPPVGALQHRRESCVLNSGRVTFPHSAYPQFFVVLLLLLAGAVSGQTRNAYVAVEGELL